MDRETVQRVRGAIDLSAEAVDALVGRIQEVQEDYARIPYAVLERIPVTAEPAKGIEQAQKAITDMVYGGIRGVNWLVATMASHALDLIADKTE